MADAKLQSVQAAAPGAKQAAAEAAVLASSVPELVALVGLLASETTGI